MDASPCALRATPHVARRGVNPLLAACPGGFASLHGCAPLRASRYHARVKGAVVRAGGLVVSAAYAAFILSVYARQPRTVRQLAGGVAASVGAYRVDPVNFADGLRY